MGIRIGIVEELIDAIDEQIANGVFHFLSFFVHFVPGEIERADEE